MASALQDVFEHLRALDRRVSALEAANRTPHGIPYPSYVNAHGGLPLRRHDGTNQDPMVEVPEEDGA